jgi:hypothetical protein
VHNSTTEDIATLKALAKTRLKELEKRFLNEIPMGLLDMQRCLYLMYNQLDKLTNLPVATAQITLGNASVISRELLNTPVVQKHGQYKQKSSVLLSGLRPVLGTLLGRIGKVEWVRMRRVYLCSLLIYFLILNGNM